MKKTFLFLLCLLFLFFNSCDASFGSVNTTDTTITSTKNFGLNNASFIDGFVLMELYKKNVNIFNVVKDDIINLPESVYSLKLENKELKVRDSNGNNISEYSSFNNKNIMECLCLLEQFASNSLKDGYKVCIYKDDFEIDFTIRDLKSSTDYSIIFSKKSDVIYARKIEGEWWYAITGLV